MRYPVSAGFRNQTRQSDFVRPGPVQTQGDDHENKYNKCRMLGLMMIPRLMAKCSIGVEESWGASFREIRLEFHSNSCLLYGFGKFI